MGLRVTTYKLQMKIRNEELKASELGVMDVGGLSGEHRPSGQTAKGISDAALQGRQLDQIPPVVRGDGLGAEVSFTLSRRRPATHARSGRAWSMKRRW